MFLLLKVVSKDDDLLLVEDRGEVLPIPVEEQSAAIETLRAIAMVEAQAEVVHEK